MSKRLELVWLNKDKLLLGLDEQGKPIWGTKADLESRLLVQLEAVGQVNPENLYDLYGQGDNLLIKGDNLLALKALERHFAGKIMCIYIDPPFNTGNAFEHYDDGLEHTIWLSMMKARLEILKKLLKEEGVIFVHIDDAEIARLRLLLEEMFGAKNYIGTIVWKRKISQSNLSQLLPPVYDYILCFAQNIQNVKAFRRSLTEAEKQEFSNPDNDPRGLWKHHDCKVKGNKEYEITSPDGTRIIGPWRFSEKNFQNLMEDGRIYWPQKKGGMPRYKVYLREMEEDLGGKIVNTLWIDEFSNQDSRREMEVIFGDKWAFDTPKPEALLLRIIGMSTKKGDWVLDSFLGSGTTTAVAHKIGRNWIGIELGEHAETLCLPRLKLVVSGEDQTGISEQVGWKGGGGFRYCILRESLFAKDEDTGLVMINPKYTNGPLVAAVCNLEDFTLNNDSIFHGVRGNLYAHITEEKVTQTYLDAIVEQLPDGKSLTVYCMKRGADINISENIKIKKIPKALQIPRYLTNSVIGGEE